MSNGNLSSGPEIVVHRGITWNLAVAKAGGLTAASFRGIGRFISWGNHGISSALAQFWVCQAQNDSAVLCFSDTTDRDAGRCRSVWGVRSWQIMEGISCEGDCLG